MLRSQFCLLSGKNDNALTELGECIYDQGGYFVINGGEKVIVAQERLNANTIYCFQKKQPNKLSKRKRGLKREEGQSEELL